MRIGILSDSHDQLERTRRAVDLLLTEGAEVLIHCGDLTSPPIVELLARATSYFVFGNCDYTLPLARAAHDLGVNCLEDGGEIQLAGKRLAVTHGHLEDEVGQLLAGRPDYLFTGHSHLVNAWDEGGVRRINPGALHRARIYTVGLLDLDSGELRTLELT
jgi:putative phosphoesterase